MPESHEYWRITGTPWTPKPKPVVAGPCGYCEKCDTYCDKCEHGLCSRCCGCDGAAEAMLEGDR